jgi:hypothetical protein
LKLKAATGELSPEDLRAINSLLEPRSPGEGSDDVTLPPPAQ